MAWENFENIFVNVEKQKSKKAKNRDIHAQKKGLRTQWFTSSHESQ